MHDRSSSVVTLSEYDLRHLTEHLSASSAVRLFRLIEHEDWYSAQREYDVTCENYALGVEQAIRLAEQTGIGGLPRLVAYSLLHATIGTVATSLPPGILEAMAYLGQSEQAMKYTALMLRPASQFDSYLRIAIALREKGENSLVVRALDGALDALESIDAEEVIEPRVVLLAEQLVAHGYRYGLRRALRRTHALGKKRNAGETVVKVAGRIIQAGWWDGLADIVDATRHLTFFSHRFSTLLQVADKLPHPGQDEWTRKLLAEAQDCAKRIEWTKERVLSWGHLACALRRIGEHDSAQEMLAEGISAARELKQGEDRAECLLALSNSATGDAQHRLLLEAVDSLREAQFLWAHQCPVGSIAQACVAAGDRETLDQLVRVATEACSEELLSREDLLCGLAGPVSQAAGFAHALSLLEHWPKSMYAGQLLLAAIAGMVTVPDPASITQALVAMEQLATHDYYLGGCIAALATRVARVSDRAALSRLVELAIRYEETRPHCHSEAWEALTTALVEMGDAPEVDGWWAILGRIGFEIGRYGAFYGIVHGLVAATQPGTAVQLGEQALAYERSDLIFGRQGGSPAHNDARQRVAQILAQQGWLDEALELLGSLRWRDQSSGYVDVLAEIAVRASGSGRTDLVRVVAQHAITENVSRLLDITAPLLARRGHPDMAWQVIDSSVSAVNRMGRSRTESAARCALLGSLAQVGEFDRAVAYSAHEVDGNHDHTYLSIVPGMANSPSGVHRGRALQLATAIENEHLKAQALCELAFGICRAGDRAALHRLLDAPELTWDASERRSAGHYRARPHLTWNDPHREVPARQLASALAEWGEYELALKVSYKIADDEAFADTCHRIVNMAWMCKSTDWVHGFLRCTVSRERRNGQDPKMDWKPFAIGYQSFDWWWRMSLWRRVWTLLEMAELLVKAHHKAAAKESVEFVVSNLPTLAALERDEYWPKGGLDNLYGRVSDILVELHEVAEAYAHAGFIQDPGKRVAALLRAARAVDQPAEESTVRALDNARKLIWGNIPHGAGEWRRRQQWLSLLVDLAEVADQCGQRTLAERCLDTVWRLGSQPLNSDSIADSILSAIAPLCQAVGLARRWDREAEAWAVIDEVLASFGDGKDVSANRHNLLKAFEVVLSTATGFQDWIGLARRLQIVESLDECDRIDLLRVTANRLIQQGEHVLAEALFQRAIVALEKPGYRSTDKKSRIDLAASMLNCPKFATETYALLQKAASDTRAERMTWGETAGQSQASTLLDIADIMLKAGHRQEASDLVAEVMQLIQKYRIGYSKRDIWPQLMSILLTTKDGSTLFKALPLAGCTDTEDWRPMIVGKVAEEVAPFATRHPKQALEAVQALLRQARESGRDEVWSYIEALTPISLRLGGGALLIEIWEHINIVESFFPCQPERRNPHPPLPLPLLD